MKSLWYALALTLVGGSLTLAGDQQKSGTRPTSAPVRTAVRVGTFDARAVALAYYRSALHEAHLQALKAERDSRQAAGDSTGVKELEAQGRAEQELAHRQVFGTGPYNSLATQLGPIWPAVLRTSDADVIVSLTFAVGDRAQVIDVTDTILDQLHADQKTRQIIRELTEKVRTVKYDPAKYHD